MELQEINMASVRIDITNSLKHAMKAGEDWSYYRFFECVELFKKSKLSVSYWKDEDDWMTLLNENGIVAYVWSKYPLMFVKENYILAVKNILDGKYNIEYIPFIDLERDIFKIDENFHLINFDFGFNKTSFSAEDFWYYTNDSL